MSNDVQTVDSGPVRESRRITSLDLIRGVAVLRILFHERCLFQVRLATIREPERGRVGDLARVC